MNLIAQQALDRARKGAPAPASKKSQRRARSGVEVIAPPLKGEPITTGPYSHVLFLAGRREAIETVQSMTALLETPCGPQEILQNLTRSAVGKPPSYAAGVCSVIDLIKGPLG
jgi:hypothetical protein